MIVTRKIWSERYARKYHIILFSLAYDIYDSNRPFLFVCFLSFFRDHFGFFFFVCVWLLLTEGNRSLAETMAQN